MAAFDDAIEVILKHEGGWCVDQGGPTMRGITLSWLRAVEPQWTADSLRAMSLLDTKRLYQQYWWHYDGIKDQRVATKIFDVAINMGSYRAITLLQRALRVSGRTVVIDGIYGPKTEGSVNSLPPHIVLLALVDQQKSYYRSIAAASPERHGPSLAGWLKRASWPWRYTEDSAS